MFIIIDPLVDFVCKLLLGNPEHIEITIHFLNAVLQPVIPIVDVEILNPIIGKQYDADKLSILDIRAIDASRRLFNIEIQRELRSWLPQRLTFYVSSQYVGQLSKGDSYFKLHPSIGICLLDAILFPDHASYHSEFRLRTVSGWELTDSLAIHLLELPKYLIPSDNGVIVEPIDQWMYFFRNAKGSTPEALAQKLPDPIFVEATGVLEMIAYSPEERRMYEERLKMRLDMNTLLQAAKEEGQLEGEIKGQLEGKIEGKKEGKKEGQLEGKLEGKKEGQLEGEIKLIRTLQELAEIPVSAEVELRMLSIGQLSSLADDLQLRLRQRSGS